MANFDMNLNNYFHWISNQIKKFESTKNSCERWLKGVRHLKQKDAQLNNTIK